MTEQKAVAALMRLIQDTYQLDRNEIERFKIWYYKAEQDLAKIYGKDSLEFRQLQNLFNGDRFLIPHIYQHFFEGCVDSISQLGLPKKNEVVVDPDTVSPKQLFNILWSMPLKHSWQVFLAFLLLFAFGAFAANLKTDYDVDKLKRERDTLQSQVGSLHVQLAQTQGRLAHQVAVSMKNKLASKDTIKEKDSVKVEPAAKKK